MKTFLKFLSRNKLYTAIEAVGLAVSLAFVLIIGTSLYDQYRIVYGIEEGVKRQMGAIGGALPRE